MSDESADESNDDTADAESEGDVASKSENAASLAEALTARAIELPQEQIEQLERYCRLLWQWNEKINLTRHTTWQRFVDRDVVDSIELERLIDSGDRVIDVGTGGGVPGILLAILRPDLDVTLTDSIAKKATAVAAIVTELELPCNVVHGRAESLLAERYDTLVVRAVAPLAKLLTWFNPHWDSIGQLLVTKGPAWVEERAAARERRLLTGLDLRKVAEYETPVSGAQSFILRITPGEE
jgi:16S rRNA (guanine527-N7)-methyltransferase